MRYSRRSTKIAKLTNRASSSALSAICDHYGSLKNELGSRSKKLNKDMKQKQEMLNNAVR